MNKSFDDLRKQMSPESQERANAMTDKMINAAPLPVDGWVTVGTCGYCSGPVRTPWAWDTNGTVTGTPCPQKCAYCGREPKIHAHIDWGPMLEMKP